jgi:DNA-directed RNA polymerase II subunit RPB2
MSSKSSKSSKSVSKKSLKAVSKSSDDTITIKVLKKKSAKLSKDAEAIGKAIGNVDSDIKSDINVNSAKRIADIIGNINLSSSQEFKDITSDINFENDTWSVIDSLFRTPNALVQHQIESFNDFMENKIADIIHNGNPYITSGEWNDEKQRYNIEYHIKFGDVYFSKPVINETNGNIKQMYPSDARLRNLTYSSPIYCDVQQYIIKYDKNDNRECTNLLSISKLKIGKIPIMLQSKCCVLSDKTNKTLSEMGECYYDQGGYFIVNGNEKVIIAYERKIENKTAVFNPNKVISKFSHIAEINSISPVNPVNVKTIHVKMTSRDGAYGKTIKVNFQRIRQPLPLFVVFRVLGVVTDKDIIQHIVYDMNLDNSKEMMDLLRPSIEESSIINSQKIALEYASKYISYVAQGKRILSETDKIKYTYKVILDEFLPHVGDSLAKKAYYLGYMVNKLLNHILGKLEYDDRDSFLNKRVETSGILLAKLFRDNFRKIIKDMKIAIDKDIKNGRIYDIDSNLSKKIKASTIEMHIRHALSTGTWGLNTATAKKGVAQVLLRLSYVSSISHLRRIMSPVQRDGQQTAPRKLHSTQYGICCPVETPEGAAIGLVKNISLTAKVTCDYSINPVLVYLEEYGVRSLDSIHPEEVMSNTKVIINGDWMGVYNEPYNLVTKLHILRRNGKLNKYISISWNIDMNEINIFTDSGRCTRPLYIVKNNNILLTTDIIKQLRIGELTWEDLLTDDIKGGNRPAIIEYLDTSETDTSMIAMKYDDLINNKKENKYFYNYTHCELHPSMMLGVLGASIPFTDHNQGPRNLYQSSMGKQAMCIYATNFQKRMDTAAYILYYPQRSIIKTRASKYVNSQNLPAGQNVIVAIMSYSGYNQEDSIIMNQSSIDRGLFRLSYYKKHVGDVKKNQSTLEVERFCKPDKLKTTGMQSGNYEKLDNDGFIRVGSKIEDNDVIIGKCIPLKNTTDNEQQFRDGSTIIRTNEEGVADWVYANNNSDGYRFCKVRVRSERIPVIGDKFAACHAQKGTVGITYAQHEMPFTKDGIVPDLIINPHAIPSRMTIGQLIECLYTKVCLLTCEDGDATPFTDLTVDDIANVLEGRCGYDRHGTEILYNGKTGKQIDASIFIGPTYYQRLKHMVSDKIHSRATGPYQLLTRCPSEGRSRNGGLRLGEMERDCLLSHGVVQFLKERLYDNSDKFVVYICKKCNYFAPVNPQKNIYKCTYCTNRTDFARVEIPYSAKLLFQELISMSISPKLLTN